MNSCRTVYTLALSACLTLFGQAALSWSCDVGKCAPDITHGAVDVAMSCKAGQKSFHVTDIENATSGPHSGTFNMIGALKNELDSWTIDMDYAAGDKAGYLKNMMLTIYGPGSVAGTQVPLSDANGVLLGSEIKDHATQGAPKTLFWSNDIDVSKAKGETILFEIQGDAVLGTPDPQDQYQERPAFWLNIFGTGCHLR